MRLDLLCADRALWRTRVPTNPGQHDPFLGGDGFLILNQLEPWLAVAAETWSVRTGAIDEFKCRRRVGVAAAAHVPYIRVTYRSPLVAAMPARQCGRRRMSWHLPPFWTKLRGLTEIAMRREVPGLAVRNQPQSSLIVEIVPRPVDQHHQAVTKTDQQHKMD
jgi:hypothetical protein